MLPASRRNPITVDGQNFFFADSGTREGGTRPREALLTIVHESGGQVLHVRYPDQREFRFPDEVVRGSYHFQDARISKAFVRKVILHFTNSGNWSPGENSAALHTHLVVVDGFCHFRDGQEAQDGQ